MSHAGYHNVDVRGWAHSVLAAAYPPGGGDTTVPSRLTPDTTGAGPTAPVEPTTLDWVCAWLHGELRGLSRDALRREVMDAMKRYRASERLTAIEERIVAAWHRAARTGMQP